MTATLRETDLPVPVRLRREARQAAWSASRETFPPRPAAAEWAATRLSRSTVLGLGAPAVPEGDFPQLEVAEEFVPFGVGEVTVFLAGAQARGGGR